MSTNVKFVFFNTSGRILQHNVSERPSVKLDHYSLYDGLKPADLLDINLPSFVAV